MSGGIGQLTSTLNYLIFFQWQAILASEFCWTTKAKTSPSCQDMTKQFLKYKYSWKRVRRRSTTKSKTCLSKLGWLNVKKNQPREGYDRISFTIAFKSLNVHNRGKFCRHETYRLFLPSFSSACSIASPLYAWMLIRKV